jgi:hypothetical protein
MKLAFAVVAAVMALCGAHAQYYGADPAPSMYAAQVGAGFLNENGQPVPAAPSMASFMAPSPAAYFGAPQPMAFVEQAQPQFAQVSGAAPYFATEEAHESEETEEEADAEGDSEEEAAEEVVEAETEEADTEEGDMRFAEKRGSKLSKALKKAKKAAKKAAKKLKNMAKKAGRAVKKFAKTLMGKKNKKGNKPMNGQGFRRGPNGRPLGPKGKPLFKPNKGKPNNQARSPSAKTPKAAGGRKLPPMPAPLPKAYKINCKKNPNLCIDAETPAEGEEPGDHSPRAVFKKKMEVIKKSLMVNNRNIAQESKWIDQVELIMKQYNIKVKKVKQHIADERKAIKELLRQRRIILNEKKQKELEAKLKMATTELTSLTDALQQVQKKGKQLDDGKKVLGSKITLLVSDLKTLRTDNEADKKQALKKAD